VTAVQEDELWQVDADGEIVGRVPSLSEALRRVAELQGQVEDLERDMRRARARERELLRGKAAERREYPRRDEVQSIVAEWREVCGHKRARLTDDRFDAVRALLEVTKPEPYPREAFSAAIAGAKFDPFVTRRKNGTEQKHDDIALICRDGKTFENFIKRAPRATSQEDE